MIDHSMFLLLGLVLALTACPSDTPRAPDDSSDPGPAEGETGEAACGAEQEKIRKLEAELSECRGPK